MNWQGRAGHQEDQVIIRGLELSSAATDLQGGEQELKMKLWKLLDMPKSWEGPCAHTSLFPSFVFAATELSFYVFRVEHVEYSSTAFNTFVY